MSQFAAEKKSTTDEEAWVPTCVAWNCYQLITDKPNKERNLVSTVHNYTELHTDSQSKLIGPTASSPP